nr:MAG TPA: hypothetical protein [Caudoviricetes sp.]DAN34916.1 MAG TPA: hypothetical protein [Caudoviricetes sp.]
MIKYISFFHCILNLSYGQYQPHRKTIQHTRDR